MDIQALMNVISDTSRMMRSGYHLTLGQAISALERVEATRLVEFDTGGSPGSPHSYRGYYSDLALKVAAPRAACDLLEDLKNALGNSYEGYKGGDYTMSENTPLWMAEYGCCGRAIVGLVADGQGPVLLQTREVE